MLTWEFLNRIKNYPSLDFEDLLIKPKPSKYGSRKDVKITRKFDRFPYGKHSFEVIPIIASNMYVTSVPSMIDVMVSHNMMVCLHKFYSVEELLKLFSQNYANNNLFYTLGMREEDYEKFNKVKNKIEIKNICLDVANGYMSKFVDYVKKIRDENPETVIMAGNVCTPEGCEDLYHAGADIIKIGIGNGKCCITRNVAGVGIPQASALIDCYIIMKKYNVYLCCDGGMREIADFSKAFVAGADFVMVGTMFGGYNQSGGNIIEKNENGKIVRMKEIYGMASQYAMERHYSHVPDYRAAEGERILVPERGDLNNLLKEIKGGIRSCMTYINAGKIEDMKNEGEFILVNRRKY